MPPVFYDWSVGIKTLSLDLLLPYYADIGLRLYRKEIVQQILKTYVRKRYSFGESRAGVEEYYQTHSERLIADVASEAGVEAAYTLKVWLEDFPPSTDGMWDCYASILGIARYRLAHFGTDYLGLGSGTAAILELVSTATDRKHALDSRLKRTIATPLSQWDFQLLDGLISEQLFPPADSISRWASVYECQLAWEYLRLQPEFTKLCAAMDAIAVKRCRTVANRVSCATLRCRLPY